MSPERVRLGFQTAGSRLLHLGIAAVVGTTVWACGPQRLDLPAPRPLITITGERLRAEPDRIAEIDAWVRAEIDSINLDPSFMISTTSETDPIFPWDGLGILADTTQNNRQDTAHVRVELATPEVVSTYQIYAHLHLMKAVGRDSVWIPEANGADGFELEKAILSRMSDAWLYARSIFDAIPYPILDELMYSKEQGYLDAYILTARPEEFAEERERWVMANPAQETEYAEWFERVFERPPPGRRGEEGGS